MSKLDTTAVGFKIISVKIGDRVWIAPRCTILKGVTIGDGAVVGTGSVVTKDVTDNCLVVGSPAVFVRHLEKDEK